MRADNERCMELLNQWKSLFPTGYKSVNMKIFKKGEGLTSEFLKKPRSGELPPGCPGIHPDLHPTAYQSVDSSEIRLILPVKGILPMGCAKGIPGHGMIHPNLINAAVLQCHGLSAANGYCDAMSLAPNFDLLLSQQLATDVARLIAEWDMEEEELGDRADLLLQTPLEPSAVNMSTVPKLLRYTEKELCTVTVDV